MTSVQFGVWLALIARAVKPATSTVLGNKKVSSDLVSSRDILFRQVLGAELTKSSDCEWNEVPRPRSSHLEKME